MYTKRITISLAVDLVPQGFPKGTDKLLWRVYQVVSNDKRHEFISNYYQGVTNRKYSKHI